MMSSVTYKNQPGIHATRGRVPLAGTSHIYSVKKVLWHESIEELLEKLFVGRVLNVCCGKSKLGHIRLDLYEESADICCDAANMREVVLDAEYDTVLCDPPYNGKFQWNHDLLSEPIRVAKKRVIFQHWFIPADPYGHYKKDHSWILTSTYIWQPRTYFGRAQIVSVFDKSEKSKQ